MLPPHGHQTMITKLHGSGGNSSHTFDRIGPDGSTLTADELARATATNLQRGVDS
jgi:hypothetical protein